MVVVLWSLIPWGVATFAAAVAVSLRPEARTRSYIQHFAAGVVLSAVGIELGPDMIREGHIGMTLIGFGSAVMLLLILRHLGHRQHRNDSHLSYWSAVAIDNFIDGVIIAVGYLQGRAQGNLLLIAVAVEYASLGMALTGELLQSERSRNQAVVAVTLTSAAVVAGTAAGAFGLSVASRKLFTAVLAFATAAFLYLVTEELLIEAHKDANTEPAAAMFFAGFLILLVIKMLQQR